MSCVGAQQERRSEKSSCLFGPLLIPHGVFPDDQWRFDYNFQMDVDSISCCCFY